MMTTTLVSTDQIVVGRSAGMRALFEYLRVIRDSESTVLITGESGTGKEVTARLLHDASRRKHRPFLAVSCALFSDTLIESELFGHERGGFTGAVSASIGTRARTSTATFSKGASGRFWVTRCCSETLATSSSSRGTNRIPSGMPAMDQLGSWRSSLQPEPQRIGELCARYGLEMDPASVPGLVERFGLLFPGEAI